MTSYSSSYKRKRATLNDVRHDMTKPTKWVCPQRRLRSAWPSAQSDQSLLCTQWVAKDPSFLHADSEDSDQTGQMPRPIGVFAGRTFTLLVLSCRSSNDVMMFHNVLKWRSQSWWFGLISVLRPFNTFKVILYAVSYPNHTVPRQAS